MNLVYVDAPTGYTRPPNEPHTEYPKFVHFADKRPSVIVNDAEEEAAALAGDSVTQKAAPAPQIQAPINSLVGQNDEETMLRKIAAEKGIHLDGRWKLAKIRKVVEAASN
jgi:hypothetical protein